MLDLKNKLSGEYYLQPTLEIARDLLGKIIVRRYRGKFIAGRIVETEAYIGEDDPACHASVGMTKRNRVMYLAGGHAYVYFTYGMHYCFNVVTEEEGFPAAVLIRAVEPVYGIDLMKKNRGLSSIFSLTNGPAKFCEAFGIDLKFNGESLLGNRIFIIESQDREKFEVRQSPRIGVKTGLDKKWRFFIKDNPYVSKIKVKMSDVK
jgi:DNA-3-methyladenine glycosylase